MNRIYLRFVLIALASFIANQGFTQKGVNEYAKQFAAVDTFLTQFKKTTQFRDNAGVSLSVTMVEAYQALFKPNTMVWDNYNPERDPAVFNRPRKPYLGAYKKIEVFCSDVLRYCPNGVNAKISAMNIDFLAIDQNVVKIALRRETDIEDFTASRMTSFEEFELTLELNPSTGKYWITEFKDIAHTIACANCEMKIAQETNPADDAKIPWKFWAQASTGLGLAKANQLIENNSIPFSSKYDQLIGSSIDPWKKIGIAGQYFASLEFEALHGYKHQFGLSAGIYYTSFRSTMNLDSAVVSYRAHDDVFSTDYMRRVRISGYTEQMSVSSVNVPLCLRYTKRYSRKWKLNLAVGPMIGLAGKAKSQASAVGDFEGIFQMNASGEFVFDQSRPLTSYDLIWTEDAVNLRSGSSSNDFWKKRAAAGHNFGVNKDLEGTSNSSASVSIGWIVRASIGKMINQTSELNFGISAVGSKVGWKSSPAFIGQNLDDRISSICFTGSGLNYMSVYAQVGYRTFIAGRKKR